LYTYRLVFVLEVCPSTVLFRDVST